MNKFNEIITAISGFVWGPVLIIALVGMGIYFTIGTRFLQIRRFPYIIKDTFFRALNRKAIVDGEGTLTPFQSAMTALSTTVGVGSIVGVAAAITIGGPGAVFWMWVSAFFGMCTKYAEITLSIAYREKTDEGYFVGGPAYYLKKGAKSKFLATWFSWNLLFSLLAFAMIHSNALTANITPFIPVSDSVIGVFIMCFIAVISFGGVTRVGKVAEKLVSLKVILYVTCGLAVIFANVSRIPEAFVMIFQGAFAPISVGGGIAGYGVMQAIRLGITRGLFSNEAGQGTAPIAHAAAKTTHPVRQGLWGITEVFIVMIVATITALCILTSGVFGTIQNPDANTLTSIAFSSVHPALGYIVSISIIFCATTSLVGICYYGESTTTALSKSPIAGKTFRIMFIVMAFFGSISSLTTVWTVGEIALAFGVTANLIGLAKCSPEVFRLTREYFDDLDNKNKVDNSKNISGTSKVENTID
ncbi:TPA: alanine/glycine:cation symporter family protein [Klebsiella pneumoniae]